MTDSVTIREATAQDGAAISALIESLADHFLLDPQDPGSAASFFDTITPTAIHDLLASDRYVYHVAESDGAIVGTVAVRDRCHLYHLFVAKSMHRRGLAARLWAAAHARASQDGGPGRFTVNATVYGVPVYERFGFCCEGPVREQDGIRFQPMVRTPDGPGIVGLPGA